MSASSLTFIHNMFIILSNRYESKSISLGNMVKIRFIDNFPGNRTTG